MGAVPDMIETLATEGGKELVKALANGLVELVKKIPALWRRSGTELEQRMATELRRSADELAEAGRDGAAAALLRAEIIWETRLRDLLAAHPEARYELEALLREIRRQPAGETTIEQHITASGQNSTAQGVIGGTITNHPFPRS